MIIKFGKLSLTLAFAVVCGCTNSSKNNRNEKDALLSDGTTFISNPENNLFLADWSKENTVVFHCTSQPDDMHPTNGNSSGRAFINNYTQLKLVASDIINLTVRPVLIACSY